MPVFRWEPNQPGALMAQNAAGLQAPKTANQFARTSGTLKPPTQAQIDSLLASMSQGPALTTVNSAAVAGLVLTNKAQALWQVRGYWKHPITGEMVEVGGEPHLSPAPARRAQGGCSTARSRPNPAPCRWSV